MYTTWLGLILKTTVWVPRTIVGSTIKYRYSAWAETRFRDRSLTVLRLMLLMRCTSFPAPHAANLGNY